jgi:hypothetical protein
MPEPLTTHRQTSIAEKPKHDQRFALWQICKLFLSGSGLTVLFREPVLETDL